MLFFGASQNLNAILSNENFCLHQEYIIDILLSTYNTLSFDLSFH